jgi:hypothetical protein
MQRPDRAQEKVLMENGWYWDEGTQAMRKEVRNTVDNFGQLIDDATKPYKPAFNDNAINPIEQEKPSRGSEVLSKLLDIDRTIAKAETKKAQAKLDSQLMSPAEKRAYVEEQGLNSNLTKAEQIQRQMLSKRHQEAVSVQQAKLRDDSRRFGDKSLIQNLVRVLQNADPQEKLLIAQALQTAKEGLHE